MNFNKFTIKAQEAIQEAINQAQALGQQVIEPVHILGGILKCSEQTASFLLQKAGANLENIKRENEQKLNSLPKVSGGEPYLSRESNQIIIKAQEIAKSFGDEFVSDAADYTYGKTPDDIAYCGPYLVSNLTAENTIVFSANPSYWNAENITMKTITWLFNDGEDALKAYNDTLSGVLDGAGLNASALEAAKAANLMDSIVYVSATDATSFGAFVDLGGVDGLIHISEMSWGRISNPREVLKEGQAVEVFVLDVDKEKGKISLSLKDANMNPWTLAVEKYAVGTVVEGKVVRMVPFGAFVELEPGVDGLVHISQIANKHVVKPEDELKVGEVIKAMPKEDRVIVEGINVVKKHVKPRKMVLSRVF